jgi:hypothetical protein
MWFPSHQPLSGQKLILLLLSSWLLGADLMPFWPEAIGPCHGPTIKSPYSTSLTWLYWTWSYKERKYHLVPLLPSSYSLYTFLPWCCSFPQGIKISATLIPEESMEEARLWAHRSEAGAPAHWFSIWKAFLLSFQTWEWEKSQHQWPWIYRFL